MTKFSKRPKPGLQIIPTVRPKSRKLAYIGHEFTGNLYELLELILQGKIEGGRGVRRRQASWLGKNQDWTDIHNVEKLSRVAENRNDYVGLIANVRGT